MQKPPAAKTVSTTPRTAEVVAVPMWWHRGIVGRCFDLFSNVRLGIVLLVLLFIYSSIGSAGVLYPDRLSMTSWNIFSSDFWAHDQLRQWRGLEMTEFEWFHWWPFSTLMILISINIVVTTLRRIPFKPVNYGVWLIHTGILVLIGGSFYYFTTKVEGDAPVARRKIIATYSTIAPDGTSQQETIDFLASPGIRAEIGGKTPISYEVTSIDPAWELLSGVDKGKRVYSVTVAIERDGKRFMRQLLDGYPEFTEDLILTGDSKQPVKRAVKELGKPIFDDALSLTLDYEPQQWFYLRNELAKSWALYVRKPGAATWTERRIDGLPLYNDYVASRDAVFQVGGQELLPLHAIDIPIPATDPADPCADVDFRVTGYLRYAVMRSRYVEGPEGSAENPVAFVTVTDDRSQRGDYRLVARDPELSRADGGVLRFTEITDEAALAPILKQPSLIISIPSQNIEIREEIRDVAAANPDAPFVEINGSGVEGKAAYAYRVVNVRDDVPIGNASVSLAILEVRTPKGVFRRWVFSDPTLTRDVVAPDASDAHGAPKLEDESIEVRYEPGNGLALVTLVHGPEQGRLRMVSAFGGAEANVQEISEGKPAPVASGVIVTVEDLMLHAVLENKPLVIPREERQRDAMEMFALIQLEAPGARAQWIPFNRWVSDSTREVLRRSPYQPRSVTLADGQVIEVLFSRQRLPLNTRVALDEFVLTSHVGGFTGAQGSIRDYTSRVRFRDPAAGADSTATNSGWSAPVEVSVNNPIEHDGLWYFQAQWDPPEDSREEGETPSQGFNYTVLGVGNRNGVYVQLLGCCIAVSGMIYAFYVKPVLKRRRQDEVLAGLGVKNGLSNNKRSDAKAGARKVSP